MSLPFLSCKRNVNLFPLGSCRTVRKRYIPPPSPKIYAPGNIYIPPLKEGMVNTTSYKETYQRMHADPAELCHPRDKFQIPGDISEDSTSHETTYTKPSCHDADREGSDQEPNEPPDCLGERVRRRVPNYNQSTSHTDYVNYGGKYAERTLPIYPTDNLFALSFNTIQNYHDKRSK